MRMIWRDRLKPMPEPSSLVVKNGMKILDWMSFGIPGPVVRHLDADMSAVVSPGRQLQRSFGLARHRLNGIPDEVDQDLLDEVGIGCQLETFGLVRVVVQCNLASGQFVTS